MNGPHGPSPAQVTRPRAEVLTRTPRRFFRSSTLMLVGAALLCVFVTLNRDKKVERLFLLSASERADQVRAHWDQMHALPVELPKREGEAPRPPLEKYADANTRFYAMRADEPVLVGYTPMAPMMASYNGRAVILFDRGEITVRWVTEGVFKRMLRAQESRVEAMVTQIRAQPAELPK
ncbi:MAG: hypothetical protein JSU68_02630 [Phycisphaerales bacterium]|nr:MAG: hypothetical protein JSU68_02630 [Phycisphaerales bacterium]